MSHDAMLMIRSELIRRIDEIAETAGRISLVTLCDQLDGIRRLARQHGLDAVEGLASMVETATAYHGHRSIVFSYLDLMRDAVESERQDEQVCLAYNAALSLRIVA